MTSTTSSAGPSQPRSASAVDAVSCTAIDAGYKGVGQVLRDVSMSLPEGAGVAVLGPNGHGKTTLMRVLSGLLRPSAGTVTLRGSAVTNLAAEERAKRGFVYVPQGDLIFGGMTVLENLLAGAFVRAAWEQRAASLDRVFALFPRLQERSSQRARTLSGGERRMLAIGRGLMTLPTVLALDEPAMGLAPKVVGEVYQTIQRLRNGGMTVLIAEETFSYAREVCDRVVVLREGRIVIDSTTDSAVNDPNFVREYLGITERPRPTL